MNAYSCDVLRTDDGGRRPELHDAGVGPNISKGKNEVWQGKKKVECLGILEREFGVGDHLHMTVGNFAKVLHQLFVGVLPGTVQEKGSVNHGPHSGGKKKEGVPNKLKGLAHGVSVLDEVNEALGNINDLTERDVERPGKKKKKKRRKKKRVLLT